MIVKFRIDYLNILFFFFFFLNKRFIYCLFHRHAVLCELQPNSISSARYSTEFVCRLSEFYGQTQTQYWKYLLFRECDIHRINDRLTTVDWTRCHISLTYAYAMKMQMQISVCQTSLRRDFCCILKINLNVFMFITAFCIGAHRSNWIYYRSDLLATCLNNFWMARQIFYLAIKMQSFIRAAQTVFKHWPHPVVSSHRTGLRSFIRCNILVIDLIKLFYLDFRIHQQTTGQIGYGARANRAQITDKTSTESLTWLDYMQKKGARALTHENKINA